MKLEVGKTYITRDGKKVRIICTDRMDNFYPSIGLVIHNDYECIVTYTKNCKVFIAHDNSDDDIISEYSFWNDVKVDTKVIVNDTIKRHFSHYVNGKIYLFAGGNTSWTANKQTIQYDISECKLWEKGEEDEC